MARGVAYACTIVVLAVFVLAGAIAGVVAAVFGSSDSSEASAAALDDIPPRYLALYRQAATLCPGLDWSILAAIGKIESDHGRSSLRGVAEGEENHAGAGGPMQFLQATWDSVTARHGIPPGGMEPPSRYNPHDAVHAAAFYLCESGARDQADLRGALFTYNRSNEYVRDVLSQAESYYRVKLTPGDVQTVWVTEQPRVDDPYSDGKITARMHALVRELQVSGMTGEGITCFGQRPQNPGSDHPRGRACDIMFNPHYEASVADGWHLANRLAAGQRTWGIRYIIWQGKFWSADNPQWVTYQSGAYNCPDPANVTGCHYDHVHVSVY